MKKLVVGLLSTAALALGLAGIWTFGTVGVARGDIGLTNDFNANAQGWQVYDYNGGSGGDNVFYPVTWESSGGVGDSGYVWGDDSRWRIDTPESPNSILSFIIYRSWVGGGALDLRDKTLSVYLRGDHLDLKGASIYFWALSNQWPGGGNRWHYTAKPLDISEGTWGQKLSFVLSNDESLWHRSWSWDPSRPVSLDSVLSKCDSYGFAFVGFSDEVTGKFSMDDLKIGVPVPEPGTMGMLATGSLILFAAALFAAAWWRFRSRCLV